MGSVSRRVYQELLETKEQLEASQLENLALKHENNRMGHHARLAYLEGVDQGRAAALREVGL